MRSGTVTVANTYVVIAAAYMDGDISAVSSVAESAEVAIFESCAEV